MSDKRINDELDRINIEKEAEEIRTDMLREKFASSIRTNIDYITDTRYITPCTYKMPKKRGNFWYKIKKFLGLV
jgi:transcriptional regulator CtsR